MADSIRVLIVDDQDMIREGLGVALRQYQDIEIIGMAGNGAEAVIMARDLRPDVVLMDLKMPVMDGIQATRQITMQLTGIQVIILTSYDTDYWVFEGVRAGAQGYLLKGSSLEAVVAAIHAVQRGESQLDPAIARKVLNAFRHTAPKAEPPAEQELPLKPLTEREREILELIAQGFSNKEIAARLCLTGGTIRNHSSKIFTKLHAYDRTQAVIKAARRGIVKLWSSAST